MLKKMAIASLLTVVSTAAFAAPAALVTINNTAVCSNAKVLGKPTPFPTAAGKTGSVNWFMVGMACDHKFPCTAEIYMSNSTDCSDGSMTVDVGAMTMDSNGNLTPAKIVNQGYAVTAAGQAAITISKA